MKGARHLTSLFFPSALLLCLPAQAARPVIDAVYSDPVLMTVTIVGSNLAGNTVYLSGFATPLVVTSSSSGGVVASLPANLAPGSYAVRVQGAGNGNFDEFFATFLQSSAGGGGCTSYSNSATSGSFGAQVSTLQGGSYAVSAKLAVNNINAVGGFHCTLNRIGPFELIDDSFVALAPSMNLVLQGTHTTSGPATYQASCTGSGGGTVSYYNWRIQAVCLPSLVSPSP